LTNISLVSVVPLRSEYLQHLIFFTGQVHGDPNNLDLFCVEINDSDLQTSCPFERRYDRIGQTLVSTKEALLRVVPGISPDGVLYGAFHIRRLRSVCGLL
jgi:hypothetical protein